MRGGKGVSVCLPSSEQEPINAPPANHRQHHPEPINGLTDETDTNGRNGHQRTKRTPTDKNTTNRHPIKKSGQLLILPLPRVWKRITDNTVILEFGEQVPTRWDKNSQTRVPVSDGVAKKYFAVKHYDPESQTLKTDLFMYERMEGEFVVMCTKLNEYFSKIMPESRKKFVDFRQFLSKKTRGSFSGKLDDGVNAAISTFIKAGGTSANYKSIHLKQNANAILFDPEGVYFLVNMSHCRAGLLNPEEAIANNTFGFYKKEDKVGARLPAHMAIVEFCDNKVTIVYGA